MRTLVLVDDPVRVATRRTTVGLIAALARRGETWLAGVDAVSWTPVPELVATRVREAPEAPGPDPRPLRLSGVDAVLLRVAPARLRSPVGWLVVRELAEWARAEGLVVVNDPRGMDAWGHKLSLLRLAPDLRPATVATRDPALLARLAGGGEIVLKPVLGTGGAGVRRWREGDPAPDETVVGQELLIADGDTRLLLLDGAPLTVQGRAAVVRRARGDDPLRANVALGGRPEAAELTPVLAELAARIGPGLARDGVWLAGIDVIQGRVIEINACAPGGLDAAEALYGAAFFDAVARALEQRVREARPTSTI